MITKFFSNKHNVYGLLLLAYILIGFLIIPNLTTPQIVLILFLIVFSNIAWYTLGMGKGITAGVIKEYHHQLQKERNDKRK